MQSTVDVTVGRPPCKLCRARTTRQQRSVSVSPVGAGQCVAWGGPLAMPTSVSVDSITRRMMGASRLTSGRSNQAVAESKNAASTRHRGVICVSDWLSHPVLPRTPSLELSVLPNGGGQIPGLAKSGPTVYNIDGAEGDRTPDLCSAIAALSQLSYSPASALARGVMSRSAQSRCQTAKAPQPCGAAVTDRNLAGHPTLSTRRRSVREVTREHDRACRAVVSTLGDDR